MALGGAEGESIREICYIVADVINKVFFGLACYAGVKVLADNDLEPGAQPDEVLTGNADQA
mgnify:CR=1 FL=1